MKINGNSIYDSNQINVSLKEVIYCVLFINMLVYWHFYVFIFIFENIYVLAYVKYIIMREFSYTLVVLQQLRRDFWILLRMLLDAKCKRLMSERSWVHWNLARSFSFAALPRSPSALISGFSSKRLCWNVQCTFPMPVMLALPAIVAAQNPP